ncbi:dsDNA nuclease domain-containing protein, partial [Klebsiella pneumoniae]|nr:dsDNA nuclease domain-containing protein [Klebsiella pneumoniae]
MAELHEVKPREQAGRDTLERYNAQIRAASIACLSILEGKDVKRVFCEFHDDFVI